MADPAGPEHGANLQHNPRHPPGPRQWPQLRSRATCCASTARAAAAGPRRGRAGVRAPAAAPARHGGRPASLRVREAAAGPERQTSPSGIRDRQPATGSAGLGQEHGASQDARQPAHNYTEVAEFCRSRPTATSGCRARRGRRVPQLVQSWITSAAAKQVGGPRAVPLARRQRASQPLQSSLKFSRQTSGTAGASLHFPVWIRAQAGLFQYFGLVRPASTAVQVSFGCRSACPAEAWANRSGLGTRIREG